MDKEDFKVDDLRKAATFLANNCKASRPCDDDCPFFWFSEHDSGCGLQSHPSTWDKAMAFHDAIEAWMKEMEVTD